MVISISVIASFIISVIVSVIISTIIIIPIIVITGAPNDMFADREVSVVRWSNPLSPSTQSHSVAPTCKHHCSWH